MTPNRNGGASTRNLIGVRLTQIPIAVRRVYGRKLMDEAADNKNLMGGLAMDIAVETPSDKVYWVPVTNKSAPAISRLLDRDVGA